MCPAILNHPPPPPSPPHPSVFSQSTSFGYFTYGNIHVSRLFSYIVPPWPSPTYSKRLFFTFVSLLLSCIQGCHYHLSKFHQFSSVTQSCLTLCDPVDFSMPGFPVHHQLPEFTQTHVHPTSSSFVVPFSSRLQSFPASGSFQMSQLFASGGQSVAASASTSVLPMNV